MENHSIQVGDRVEVVQVAHPELPSHAKYLGKTGTVEKVLKGKPEIKVKFDARHDSLRIRYCNPAFVKVVA